MERGTIASQRRREIIHRLTGSGLHFEVVVDNYRREQENIVVNSRHSIARRLSPHADGQAWTDDAGPKAPFGEVVFIPANVPITVKGSGGQIRMARFEFAKDRFPIVEQTLRLIGVALGELTNVRSPTIARLLQVLSMEAEAPQAAAEIYLEGIGCVIVAELVRHLNQFSQPEIRNFTERLDVDLDIANDYIRYNLGRPILVSEVAELYGVSERHLGRMFRDVTGRSVHEYIEHIRITHAARLLAQGEFSVKQIGFRVGYMSQTSFAVAFRRVIGCPPSAYRRSILTTKTNGIARLPHTTS